MDLCPILFYLILIVAVVAVLGHGLWGMIGAFFRAIFGPDHHRYPSEEGRRSDPRRGGRHVRTGCAYPFPRSEQRCPECGLRFDDPRAGELGKLDNPVAYLHR